MAQPKDKTTPKTVFFGEGHTDLRAPAGLPATNYRRRLTPDEVIMLQNRREENSIYDRH
jgi:hypothetical protein